jgi:hypothetical protein
MLNLVYILVAVFLLILYFGTLPPRAPRRRRLRYGYDYAAPADTLAGAESPAEDASPADGAAATTERTDPPAEASPEGNAIETQSNEETYPDILANSQPESVPEENNK